MMAGWQVTLSARSTDILTGLHGDIGATAVPLDVTGHDGLHVRRRSTCSPPSPRSWSRSTPATMRRCHSRAPDSALFERLNRVNYLGPVYVLGAVLPLLRDRGGGSADQCERGRLSWPAAFRPTRHRKAAAIHLAEALHLEAARWGDAPTRDQSRLRTRSRLTDQNRFHMPD